MTDECYVWPIHINLVSWHGVETESLKCPAGQTKDLRCLGKQSSFSCSVRVHTIAYAVMYENHTLSECCELDECVLESGRLCIHVSSGIEFTV